MDHAPELIIKEHYRRKVSARFLLYSKSIFFVSYCDLLYPLDSANA